MTVESWEFVDGGYSPNIDKYSHVLSTAGYYSCQNFEFVTYNEMTDAEILSNARLLFENNGVEVLSYSLYRPSNRSSSGGSRRWKASICLAVNVDMFPQSAEVSPQIAWLLPIIGIIGGGLGIWGVKKAADKAADTLEPITSIIPVILIMMIMPMMMKGF